MQAQGRYNNFIAWNNPSVDRKIPELGYIKGNIVWCCYAVNSFKQAMTDKDFLGLVHNITWKEI